MRGNKLKKLEIINLWDSFDFSWNQINSDINILVGVNGSGKSTFIHIIKAMINKNTEYLKSTEVHKVVLTLKESVITYEREKDIVVEGNPEIPFMMISTWELPILYKRALRPNERALDAELDALVYQRQPDYYSFTDYRLKALNNEIEAQRVKKHIEFFFSRVNKLFSNTCKTIELDRTKNVLQFKCQSRTIPLALLSSGEKQLLILLLKVLLTEEKNGIIMLDEPEVSLHIEWQYHLIDEILLLNPNAQLIISSHSPSLFGKGWGDKLIYLEDLIEEEED